MSIQSPRKSRIHFHKSYTVFRISYDLIEKEQKNTNFYDIPQQEISHPLDVRSIRFITVERLSTCKINNPNSNRFQLETHTCKPYRNEIEQQKCIADPKKVD